MNKKAIGFYTATSIVIANMIGTGVFTSLGFQVLGIHSVFSLLLLWFIGGVVALCGALCYSELAAAMPRSGSEYHYLSKIYHPSVGFLSGWVSMTVGFAAPVALSAILLGGYVSKVFPDVNPTGLAIIVVMTLTIIHCLSLKTGGRFQNVFTFLKIALILFIIISGFLLPTHQTIQLMPDSNSFSEIASSSFVISLFWVSYSYSGWNASAYIAGDIESPQKNVPRSLFTGTVFVAVLYILLNFIFLYTTPIQAMAGQKEVGFIAANFIFGKIGGAMISLIIALLLVSSVSSMIIAGPRVSQVMGEDNPLLGFLSVKNKFMIPFIAIIFQSLISIILILTSTFEQVLIYVGFTLNIFTFLTVLGLIIFRIKQPNIERPYKTWGYPVTPLLFLSVTLWILFYGLISKPYESLIGIATVSSGLVVYYIGKKMKKEVAFILVVIGTLFMFSCGQNKAPETKETPKKDTVASTEKKTEKHYDRTFNDISRFIVGMPQDTGSKVSPALTNSYYWKQYSSEIDKEWEKLTTKRLNKMNEWAAKELKAERDSKLDLFYPFSGPDILHALTFYPDAKNYYLFALEKCGSLPALSEMDSSMTKDYLNSVNNSLQDIFNKSYFITRKMMNDLSKSNVNGTLPLICVFLSRTDNEILEINYFHLNEDGTYIETNTDSLKSFVKVDFRKKGKTQIQSVYYFKTNFGNKYLEKNHGMLAFLSKMDSCNTYLKSASYLLHYPTFSTIRDIILKKSKSILEDDTGIPYKYFSDKVWKVSIYGKYIKPVKDFAGVYQTDLQTLYEKDSTRQPLPFSLGYHWGDKNQNLIRAVRH